MLASGVQALDADLPVPSRTRRTRPDYLKGRFLAPTTDLENFSEFHMVCEAGEARPGRRNIHSVSELVNLARSGPAKVNRQLRLDSFLSSLTSLVDLESAPTEPGDLLDAVQHGAAFVLGREWAQS